MSSPKKAGEKGEKTLRASAERRGRKFEIMDEMRGRRPYSMGRTRPFPAMELMSAVGFKGARRRGARKCWT